MARDFFAFVVTWLDCLLYLEQRVLIDYLNLNLMRLRILEALRLVVKRLDFRRNVRNIRVTTERSTISVFHGQLIQGKGLLMPFVCLVVEISAWLRVVLKI